MEKLYEDYIYHINRAVEWYYSKHKDAKAYHKAHLDWANQILVDFKKLYR